MKGNYIAIWVSLLILFYQCPVFAAEAELIQDMNALVEQGRYQEAYNLGQSNLFELEGEAEFDFLFGLAALETGHPTEAMFAFERLLVSYPNQQRVKLELARAYFISNNLIPAKQLFREVLETRPGDAIEANIENFLSNIEIRNKALESSFDWYLSSGIGNDSNINSATELGIIPTSIGNIILDPNGQGISDNFLDHGIGFSYRHPLSKNHAIIATGDYTLHNNLSSGDFDLDIISADVAYVALGDSSRLSQALRIQRVGLDGELFQTSASLVSTWQHTSAGGWAQALTGAYSLIRYDTDIDPENNLRDINQVLLSAIISKSSGKYSHNLSVYYGAESSVKSEGKYNAQNFYGLAYTEQFQVAQGHIPYLRFSLQRSKNRAVAPSGLFGFVAREDDTISVSSGWNWQVNQNLSVSADISYTDQDSNVVLYKYDRLKYQVGFRYQF